MNHLLEDITIEFLQEKFEKNEVTPEIVAKFFHETYEKLAPDFGYKTRKDSNVDWKDVPDKNKKLMIAVAEKVIERFKL